MNILLLTWDLRTKLARVFAVIVYGDDESADTGNIHPVV